MIVQSSEGLGECCDGAARSEVIERSTKCGKGRCFGDDEPPGLHCCDRAFGRRSDGKQITKLSYSPHARA